MNRSRYWPDYLPWHLEKPDTTLFANVQVSALRYGSRPAIGFFGHETSYSELCASAERLAAWLRHRAGVAPGDRVMVFMQNCPQWVMAFYGILRADAVVVPANPMYKAAELRQLLQDSGAKVLLCSAELGDIAKIAATDTTVQHIVRASYADYLPHATSFILPEWITSRAAPDPDFTEWAEVMATQDAPPDMSATPDSLAILNYTSGSTGVPKACMHTHRTFMHPIVGLSVWHGHAPGTAFLGVAPMYQVAGLTVGVGCSIYTGGLVVPMPRWDRKLAAQLIHHYRIAYAGIAPTALIDMLADKSLDLGDLSSLKRVSFGGATMPDSVWQSIHEKLGLTFIEAYGMTETAATTHINPVHRPKRQCAGIPFFDTDTLIVEPESERCVAQGESGEILISGPQLFKGYWNKPEATRESMIEIDGKTYFRSGDIGYFDEEGYLHIMDRVKRMINASGFKVWPAEVENKLYDHPDVLECCVIGQPDAYRGESVKAIIVLREERRGQVSEQEIIAWAKERMAAFKYPRSVQFVDTLPKSPVGKTLWRELQEKYANLAHEAASQEEKKP